MPLLLLSAVLQEVRSADTVGPVLVHVITEKGRGYLPAETAQVGRLVRCYVCAAVGSIGQRLDSCRAGSPKEQCSCSSGAQQAALGSTALSQAVSTTCDSRRRRQVFWGCVTHAADVLAGTQGAGTVQDAYPI